MGSGDWLLVDAVDRFEIDLPEEVAVGGRMLAIYRTAGGFYATAAMCTHEEEHLYEGYFEDGVIECPKHMARFDVRTGRALCLPATTALSTYRCDVRGAELWVFVPGGA